MGTLNVTRQELAELRKQIIASFEELERHYEENGIDKRYKEISCYLDKLRGEYDRKFTRWQVQIIRETKLNINGVKNLGR